VLANRGPDGGFLKPPRELAIADQSMRATHIARVAVVTRGPPPLVDPVLPLLIRDSAIRGSRSKPTAG